MSLEPFPSTSRPAPAPRRVVIIANPAARRGVPEHVLRVAAGRALPGWDVEIAVTQGRADAARLGEAAARVGVEVVVACGGDGTLNGVLNGVLAAPGSKGARPAIGLIPAGTANVWAKEAGIPHDPERALALLEAGLRVPLDVGVATLRGVDRRFLLMCGIGLDAAVVRRVEARPRLKYRLGPLAFAGQGLGVLARLHAPYARVTVDGVEERLRLALGVAANTRLYGGVTRIAATARADDGLLDMVTFASGGRGAVAASARQVIAALRGGLDRSTVRGVSYRRGARVTVAPERALAVQVDGEWIGECGPEAPLTLTVEPRAATFVVPAVPSPLFSLPAVP
ncbi:MAG: diacylglycerol kinase family protein [Chloroflexi bacterium]|nr:diacylglycerol kinase family protein [Chloroflexota bacterium]MDA1241217.1 diacylglycerol kinase family protein [Chloroflexota bacterium]